MQFMIGSNSGAILSGVTLEVVSIAIIYTLTKKTQKNRVKVTCNVLLSTVFFPLSLHSSIQSDLYEETFRPIVEAVLQGYNGMWVESNLFNSPGACPL